jgi:hypothetical protein
MALRTNAPPHVSTYSGGSGNCVQVARTAEAVRVRDTKQKGRGPELAFSERAWVDFLGGLRSGELR